MLTGAEGREEVAGGALVVKGGSLDGAGVGLSLEPRRSQSLVEGWAMSVRRGEVFHRHCSLGHRVWVIGGKSIIDLEAAQRSRRRR